MHLIPIAFHIFLFIIASFILQIRRTATELPLLDSELSGYNIQLEFCFIKYNKFVACENPPNRGTLRKELFHWVQPL